MSICSSSSDHDVSSDDEFNDLLKEAQTMVTAARATESGGSDDDNNSDDCDSENEDLIQSVHAIVSHGKELQVRCDAIVSRDLKGDGALKGKQGRQLASGLQKLTRRLDKELDFLDAMLKNPEKNLTLNKIKSSNMSNFAAVIDVLEASQGVCGVWQPIVGGSKNTLKAEVDVVTDGGLRWYKVKASTRGLVPHMEGMGHYGEKSLLEQMRLLMGLAKTRLVNGCVPEVCLYLLQPVSEEIIAPIRGEGVTVVFAGELPLSPVSVVDPIADGPNTKPAMMNHSKINLDVTALVAWTSELTNSDATNVAFPTYPVLNAQALDEREHPVLCTIETVCRGKDLIACERAVAEFKNIVDCVAGEKERVRADALLSRVTVVPDTTVEHVQALRSTGRIGDRQKTIFGTGVAFGAVTLTANKQFIQAAAEQGVFIPHEMHAARALTERKTKSIS
eukprot:PhM_4_TR13566/c0_g1_i1/m.38684